LAGSKIGLINDTEVNARVGLAKDGAFLLPLKMAGDDGGKSGRYGLNWDCGTFSVADIARKRDSCFVPINFCTITEGSQEATSRHK